MEKKYFMTSQNFVKIIDDAIELECLLLVTRSYVMSWHGFVLLNAEIVKFKSNAILRDEKTETYGKFLSSQGSYLGKYIWKEIR